MKALFLTVSFLVAFVFSMSSQISQGGAPSFPYQKTGKSDNIPVVKMPAIDIEKLQREDAAEASKDIPPRFAYGHEVNLNPTNSGKWHTMNNGDQYWMLRIESTGAKSINFTFSDFYIPKGANLFFYNPDKTDVRGSFTFKNNKKSGKIGIAPIEGDVVVIEYYQPANIKEKPALQLETIAHDYKGIKAIAKDYGYSGSCNNDVVCSEGDPWRDQIRSVALITVNNGRRWCSGVLLNNTNNDGTPYFLSANHCLIDQVGTVDTWVFHFNYESPRCNNPQDGQLDQSISGSELLATSPETDYLLLQLSAKPPSSYNVYYSGWDASGNIPDGTVTTIHHPSGDVKKISFENDPISVSGYYEFDVPAVGTTHWRVMDWDDGTTEPGSSGSPLYDKNKRIIGQLHGGDAACGVNDPDWYGKFDITFNEISQWLSPGSNTLVADGYQPPTVGGDCVEVTMSLKFDNYPEETGWEIINNDGVVVWSGSNYGNREDGSMFNSDFCLDEGCYTLVFKDTYGDGICCGYGLGSYQLKDESGILASGAAFGTSEEKEFCVGRNRVVAPASETKDSDRLSNPLARLKLFPNPARSFLNIEYKLKEDSNLVVQVIDITGRIVQNQAFEASLAPGSLQVNVSQLSEGSYFLKITENNAEIVKKFMVVR